ncbi:MAG: HD domain-containing protein [Candidatus Latescibacterota bacterium]
MNKQPVKSLLAEIERICLPYCINQTTEIHGLEHLRRVACTAGRIALWENEDMKAAVVGGFLHDCARVNDGGGQEHAYDSAIIAEEVLRRHFPELDADRVVFAIHHHAAGLIAEDLLVGAIWDADRLDLVRLGVRVRTELLSTRIAKRVVGIRNSVSEYHW